MICILIEKFFFLNPLSRLFYFNFLSSDKRIEEKQIM